MQETRQNITVEALIDAPIDKVWKFYNEPEHVMQWNYASDDWHSPSANSDFKVGGKFSYRMEARDGSQGFDFTGIFDTIENERLLEYTIDDGRRVKAEFNAAGPKTRIKVTFDAEQTNPISMQRAGWQAILDNFKKYAESHE